MSTHCQFTQPRLRPVIALLFKRGFYRTRDGIRRISSGGASPKTSTTRSSPATRLPLEVVEIIISYLIYDRRSLRACTLTCYSWYIAAVPHLHHTLTVSVNSWPTKFWLPNAIWYMNMLGLLPLVKRLRIRGYYSWEKLSPKLFTCCILRHFRTLTNVRKLEIDRLDIPRFMPRIKRYFKHFMPTVRSLFLREPRGSNRQIIYFIGLFQHLQDLRFFSDYGLNSWKDLAGDPTLVPEFVPPLRGWLRLTHFRRAGLLKDMIHLFGGIRFRYLHFHDVDGMRLVLDACAKTLENLVLDPTDPRSEQLSLKSIRVLANNSQLRPPPTTLIYHNISRFGRSRSRPCLSNAHRVTVR